MNNEIPLNRAQLRANKSKKRDIPALRKEAHAIKFQWEELLKDVEQGSESNSNAAIKNISAQTYLLDRINECEDSLDYFYGHNNKKKLKRDFLAGKVNARAKDLNNFLKEVLECQPEE